MTYDYDAADRITKVLYPDGTFETYSYDKLDLAAYQDGLGRRTAIASTPAGGVSRLISSAEPACRARRDRSAPLSEWPCIPRSTGLAQ